MINVAKKTKVFARVVDDIRRVAVKCAEPNTIYVDNIFSTIPRRENAKFYIVPIEREIERIIVVSASAMPEPTVPAPPILAPTLTPTSIWRAQPTKPTAIPQATAQPVTTTTVSVARNAANDAHVRFVHAAALARPMDVYVNGVKLYSARGYMSVSPYIGFPAGIYTVHTTAQGETPVLWRTIIRLDARNAYSLIALQEMRAEVLVDDNTLPEYGQIRLRAVHVSDQWLRTATLRFDTKKRILMIDDGRSAQIGDYAAVPDKGVAIQLLDATRQRSLPTQQWQMGMVYTLWIFAGKSAPQVGMSEDAFKLYPLLPETGGDSYDVDSDNGTARTFTFTASSPVFKVLLSDDISHTIAF